jgi:hypothetical protein
MFSQTPLSFHPPYTALGPQKTAQQPLFSGISGSSKTFQPHGDRLVLEDCYFTDNQGQDWTGFKLLQHLRSDAFLKTHKPFPWSQPQQLYKEQIPVDELKASLDIPYTQHYLVEDALADLAERGFIHPVDGWADYRFRLVQLTPKGKSIL